jgi:putative transposase
MPRKPRFYLPDVPAHVIQRGNNRQAVFYSDNDYRTYLGWLGEGAVQHGCTIHAYVLMTNHVHMLVTPEARDSISRMIQFIGRNYVSYINHRYKRSGTLWEGRHKGSIISSEVHLLTCSRYIELNPVRAGMVDSPVDYPWSSYRHNATGDHSALLKPHAIYLALGDRPVLRQQVYRALFQQTIDSSQIHNIRTAVQTGTPLGNDRFREQIEKALMCKVGQARRGRPARPQNR